MQLLIAEITKPTSDLLIRHYYVLTKRKRDFRTNIGNAFTNNHANGDTYYLVNPISKALCVPMILEKYTRITNYRF